jgi:hypothetical protein
MKLESKELQKAQQLAQDCRDAASVLQSAGLFMTGVGILRETATFLTRLAEPTRTPIPWGELTYTERVDILVAYRNGQPIEWVYHPELGWGSEGENTLNGCEPVWAPEVAYRVMERRDGE